MRVKWNRCEMKPRYINNGMPILKISLPKRRIPPQYGWFLWWVVYGSYKSCDLEPGVILKKYLIFGRFLASWFL